MGVFVAFSVFVRRDLRLDMEEFLIKHDAKDLQTTQEEEKLHAESLSNREENVEDSPDVEEFENCNNDYATTTLV